jgi:hypothetical protein
MFYSASGAIRWGQGSTSGMKRTHEGNSQFCGCEDAAELRSCCLGEHFMEPSNHDMIPLYKILYFIAGTGLLAEWKRWGCTIDEKMVTVQGTLICPPYSM